jgi:hypothetical protein
MVICPDIEFVASSFGGGWLVSHTPAGEDFGQRWYANSPIPLTALGGDPGWIVEPYEVRDIIESALSEGLHLSGPAGAIVGAIEA